MLAYTRGINDDYKSTGYCDRVDIDIMNAIYINILTLVILKP